MWAITTRWTTGRKYYYFDSKRIAVNRGGTRSYLASDHLNSTSVWTNSEGMEGGNQQYYAYGANRAGSGDTPTDYQFTGQRRDFSSNLYQMGARWYDPLVGRFLSPDTIVPKPENPQALNRYAYTADNPLKYTDPTGHDLFIVGGMGWDSGGDPYDDPQYWERWICEYKGWDHDTYMSDWYIQWTTATSDKRRMEIAQSTGIAIFKWDSVFGTEKFPQNSEAAARAVQKQINEWGLKDVTIVGHSKGADVLTTLMDLYSSGKVEQGATRNIVLVDPVQSPLASGLWATTSVDAFKAHVQAVFLPGWAACGLDGAACNITVRHASIFPYESSHSLRSDMAPLVYDALNVQGDAHASVKHNYPPPTFSYPIR